MYLKRYADCNNCINLEFTLGLTENVDDSGKKINEFFLPMSLRVEDSSVEKGGVIVETDFGSIDARISSQLTELENKILEVSPLKSIKRQDSLTQAE